MCEKEVAQATRIGFTPDRLPVMQSISLSHADVCVLLKPPADFDANCKYSHLLDEVVSTNQMIKIDGEL